MKIIILRLKTNLKFGKTYLVLSFFALFDFGYKFFEK